ncbi:MAG: ABC transporter permease, partial [Mycobacterium sp.]
FVLQRSLHGLLSLVGIVLLVFVLSRLTGSPARLYLPEDATEAMVQQFDAANGFDQPLYVQLWTFIKGITHLDFGKSLLYKDSALSIVMTRYPATLKLAAVATVIFTVVGVLVGCIGAARKGTKTDDATRLTSLVALSVPDFWVGITGIAVFAVFLDVLPTSGAGGVQYWILPLIALSLRPIGVLTQVARSTMIEQLDSEYVRVARGKGVAEASVVLKHALRNAALPIVTVAGVLLAQLVNGALVVETVFGWPGVGNLMVTAIRGRDFAVIQAVVLVTGAAIILLNFLIDLAYSWLNPQIRLGAMT